MNVTSASGKILSLLKNFTFTEISRKLDDQNKLARVLLTTRKATGILVKMGAKTR